jgi:hypothetical protein
MSLAELFYARSRARHAPRPRRQRPRFVFEPLESRLLLSADPGPLILDEILSPPDVPAPSAPVSASTVVNVPTNLSGTPGATVPTPINIDDAQGLEAADIDVGYDVALLEVLAVRRGTISVNATLFDANFLTLPGKISIGMAFVSARPSSS